MANSRSALEAEKWIRDIGLKTIYPDKVFTKKIVKLCTGGEFEFDCVDKDETIFAHVSTSKGKTASGKASTGPIHKVRGESLWFNLLDKPQAKMIFIFTEQSLKDVFEEEKRIGRWPSVFDLLHIALPKEYQEQIEELRILSRDELKALPEELNELSDSLGEEIIEEIKRPEKS